MARPWENDPSFGTRGEDWLHPEDIDSDTSGGREPMERAEAAMEASTERRLRQRREENELAGEAAHAHYGIPKDLYIKAKRHQDQLTQAERQLLLTRGGAIGKALAQPDTLTEEETYEVLLLPAPNVVRANIAAVRGRTSSTPFELYARGKGALAHGQQLTDLLSHEEILLLARRFHTEATYNFQAQIGALCQPGATEAHKLVQARLGLDQAVIDAATAYYTRHICETVCPKQRDYIPPQRPLGPLTQEEPQEIIYAINTLYEQRQNGSITAEETDARSEECLEALRLLCETGHVPDHKARSWPPVLTADTIEDKLGSGPWPPGTRHAALWIFAKEKNLCNWWVSPGWLALSEDQRQVYRNRCEALRCKAWAEHERQEAQWIAPGSRGKQARHSRETAEYAYQLQYQQKHDRAIFAKHATNMGTEEERDRVLRIHHKTDWDEWCRLDPDTQSSGRLAFVTGLGIYCAELGVESPEGLKRWKGLSAEQKRRYEDKAAAQNDASLAAKQREQISAYGRAEAARMYGAHQPPAEFRGQDEQGDKPPLRYFAINGYQLLRYETKLGAAEVHRMMDGMTEEEKQALEERARVLRVQNEADWAEWHRRNPQPPAGGQLRRVQRPEPMVFITGLGLYRDELGIEFWEAQRRWEGLTTEQKKPYEDRAAAQNEASTAARRQRLAGWIGI